jgi:hypothetical protein
MSASKRKGQKKSRRRCRPRLFHCRRAIARDTKAPAGASSAIDSESFRFWVAVERAEIQRAELFGQLGDSYGLAVTVAQGLFVARRYAGVQQVRNKRG